ncbi:MAG TPA: ATP-binding protein, partial [Ktedonobacterales bacterium]|nr:ATP-binding protein [Ktedonobacterales bacterium]
LVTTSQEDAIDLDAWQGEPAASEWRVGAPSAGAVRRVLALVQRVLGGRYTAATLAEIETDTLTPLGVVGVPPEMEERWWLGLGRQPVSSFLPSAYLERLMAEEVIEQDLSAQPPVRGQDYFGLGRTLIVGQPLPDRQLCIIGIEVLDRPALTQQERDLARAAVRLVALVVERVRLLREREAARLRELALEEATRRMDEFLGIASHELRTPLTSVSANVQMAARTLGALSTAITDVIPETLAARMQRSRDLLERTNRQTARLDRLVGDLLDTSRIQAGKLELRAEPCDLATIVREATQEQRVAWPARVITLDIPRRSTIPLVADMDRIGQVVTNLLTNALKYSAEDRPVAVYVRVDSETAWVEVRDQGPGLTAEQQARLWERFYRVPGIEQQSGSGVGLGLGLHICKTIIERHGGQVGVESEPGVGSAFWFTLPLASE